MLRTMLYAKLHRVKVTQADLNDVGSATIDRALPEAVILAQAQMDGAQARTFVPRGVFADHDNRIVEVGGDHR